MAVSSDEAGTAGGRSLARAGFHPFYPMAAGFIAISMPLWSAMQLGGNGPAHMDVLWHIHEMVFGFISAVLLGFLYGAARAGTGLAAPRGMWLGTIAGLWCAGRVAMVLTPTPLAAAVDCAFLFLAPLPFHRVLRQARMRRDTVLVDLLCLLALLNFLYHAAGLGWLRVDRATILYAAVMVSAGLTMASADRCMKSARTNADGTVAGEYGAHRHAIRLTLLAGAAGTVGLHASIAAGLAFAAAAALVRRRLADLWISLGLILLGFAQFGVVRQDLALYVIVLGTGASIVLDMMRGQAGSGDSPMPVLAQAAVLACIGAAVLPAASAQLLVLSALCWSAGFFVYLQICLPVEAGRTRACT